MGLLRFSKIYLFIGGFAIATSMAAIVVFGLHFGIDFTGGSALAVEYSSIRPSAQQIQGQLADLDLGSMYAQSVGEKGMLIRMKHISEETHQQVLSRLGAEARERSFESIGPAVGRDLRDKTLRMVLLALAAILIYVTFAFRKALEYAHSWQYGLTILLTAMHDVLIPTGILAFLGKFYGAEISIPVVVALLTVLGYSINDTIVVFDRVRENVIRRGGADFRGIVNKSLREMFLRCVNAYLTTLFPLFALYFFAGETLRHFSLTLIVGIIAGIYSSLFLAPAFLVHWIERKNVVHA